jgi:hypothetical protein
MANEENLKPPFNELSKEERTEIARKGAKATNKKRREKKALKERLELMLEIVKDKQKKDLPPEIQEELDGVGADVYAIMQILFSKKTKTETKLNALDRVWDRIHGKAKQEIKTNNTTKTVEINLTPEEFEEKYRAIIKKIEEESK